MAAASPLLRRRRGDGGAAAELQADTRVQAEQLAAAEHLALIIASVYVANIRTVLHLAGSQQRQKGAGLRAERQAAACCPSLAACVHGRGAPSPAGAQGCQLQPPRLRPGLSPSS